MRIATSPISFDDNAAGGRVSRTDRAGVREDFSYDGDDLLAEFEAGGAFRAVYTHGALGAVSMQLPAPGGGIPRFYHPDGLGSVHHLTDGTGTVTDAYDFDAFGVPWPPSGSSYNPHRFVGQLGYYFEPDTTAINGVGLLKLGARYYDPPIGRFITQDPLGYAAGMNGVA